MVLTSRPRRVAVLVVACVLGGAWTACIHGGREASVSISREQAIEAAKRFAREQGLAVDRYDAAAERDGDAWSVHFSPGPGQPKPAPGDFFTVVIDGRGARPPRLVHGK